MVGKTPDLQYSQPRAFCRTLVYQWGGEMLFGGLEEKSIVGNLVTAEKTPDMSAKRANVAQIHGSNQTVAYDNEDRRSPDNPLPSQPSLKFYGYAWAPEEECDPQTVRDKVRVKLWSGLSALGEAYNPSRRAYCLSLRYRYQHGLNDAGDAVDPAAKGRKSGHAVGFYGSTARFPASRKGYRFFDPNIGVWKFEKLDDMMRLFLDEWLVEFMANTLERDPGDSPLEGARKATMLRFIEFEKASG